MIILELELTRVKVKRFGLAWKIKKNIFCFWISICVLNLFKQCFFYQVLFDYCYIIEQSKNLIGMLNIKQLFENNFIELRIKHVFDIHSGIEYIDKFLWEPNWLTIFLIVKKLKLIFSQKSKLILKKWQVYRWRNNGLRPSFKLNERCWYTKYHFWKEKNFIKPWVSFFNMFFIPFFLLNYPISSSYKEILTGCYF